MTEIERAIETLKNSNKMLKNHMDETMDFIHTYADSSDDYNFDNAYSTIDYCEKEYRAVEIAISALTEQAERSKGCEYCTQGEEMAYGVDTLKRTAHIYLDGNLLTADLYSDSMSVAVCYCLMCGRKL